MSNDTERAKHITPFLDKNFAKGETWHHLETGHALHVSGPIDHPGIPEMNEWRLNVAHPKKSVLYPNGRRGMSAYSESMGKDASQVPSRINEFLVGQHGMDIMRQQMAGNYDSQHKMIVEKDIPTE